MASTIKENEKLDQDLVAIVEKHLVAGEINDESVGDAADAIEKLAAQRAERPSQA